MCQSRRHSRLKLAEKTYCSKHNEWVMKVPTNIKTNFLCGKFKNKRCGNQGKWRCPHGSNNVDTFHCKVSICVYFPNKINDDDYPFSLGITTQYPEPGNKENTTLNELDGTLKQDHEEPNDEEMHELNINIIDDVFDNTHKLNTNEENGEFILDDSFMMNEIDLVDDDAQRV